MGKALLGRAGAVSQSLLLSLFPRLHVILGGPPHPMATISFPPGMNCGLTPTEIFKTEKQGPLTPRSWTSQEGY